MNEGKGKAADLAIPPVCTLLELIQWLDKCNDVLGPLPDMTPGQQQTARVLSHEASNFNASSAVFKMTNKQLGLLMSLVGKARQRDDVDGWMSLTEAILSALQLPEVFWPSIQIDLIQGNITVLKSVSTNQRPVDARSL